ncbi:hypothetical protein HID58_079369, partial [Brassica napus]
KSERERERKTATMFSGMFMEKPDKAVALKQLRTHVALFGGWVVVVRAVPYILSVEEVIFRCTVKQCKTLFLAYLQFSLDLK